MEPKQGIITLHKEAGETPLECIERWRKSGFGQRPEYQGVALSYLGRLDPMAEGVLLVAVGEENKNREAYLGLDKEYEFEVLFGFETDTYDLLGVATGRVMKNMHASFSAEKVLCSSDASDCARHIFHDPTLCQNPAEELLRRPCADSSERAEQIFSKKLCVPDEQFSCGVLIGKHIQKYPPYSSRTVNGKPLWMWAREGKLNEIEIPTIEIEIYDFKELRTREISKADLLEQIEEKIGKVKGDFRQVESLQSWKRVLTDSPEDTFKIGSFSTKCSAGTYVRSLANDMGGVAFKIKRTKVGDCKQGLIML